MAFPTFLKLNAHILIIGFFCHHSPLEPFHPFFFFWKILVVECHCEHASQVDPLPTRRKLSLTYTPATHKDEDQPIRLDMTPSMTFVSLARLTYAIIGFLFSLSD